MVQQDLLHTSVLGLLPRQLQRRLVAAAVQVCEMTTAARLKTKEH
jgi:hypothetical protein